MLFHMDIQDLEHSAYCTEVIANLCMHTPVATNYTTGSSGGASCLVLEPPSSVKSAPSPKSPLSASQSANSSQPTNQPFHFGRNGTSRPLTSSPIKNNLAKDNNENSNGGQQRLQQLRQAKHSRFNQASSANSSNVNGKNGGVYRRNHGTILPKIVFHSKQQNHELQSAAQKQTPNDNTNGISKPSTTTCDIVASSKGINGNHNSLSKRHLNLNGNSGHSKKNSKVDLPLNANKNYKRGNSFEDANGSRPKKTRRSRKRSRKRPVEPSSSVERQQAPKRMRWTECNANEVSRLHRNCVQNGQPLAPYNTTQFIMNEHNAEKEIDFDELSGQLQQMHNSRRQATVESGGSECEEPLRDDFYYSSPDDESYFLEQQFHEAYDTMHAERLNSMSKGDLLKEYLLIEKELESLRQKSPSSSVVDSANPNQSSTVVTKSPRPPSMPSSPRHSSLAHKEHHQHHHRNQHHNNQASSTQHHHYNGNSQHRNLFKENKHLRKMLKQVYSRYSSLLNCIRYVNSTNNTASSSETGSSSGANLDESGASSCTSGHHQVTPEEYHLSNEMHFRIEKYLTCHPSPSPMSSSSNSNLTSSSSTTITSSSSASSTSTTTTNASSEEDQELEHPFHHPQNEEQELSVACLLQELVDLVVEGN